MLDSQGMTIGNRKSSDSQDLTQKKKKKRKGQAIKA